MKWSETVSPSWKVIHQRRRIKGEGEEPRTTVAPLAGAARARPRLALKCEHANMHGASCKSDQGKGGKDEGTRYT